MRVGIGLAYVNQNSRDLSSTTFAALCSAVVDALLGAAGLNDLRPEFSILSPVDKLKQIELKLYYHNYSIVNIDCTFEGDLELKPGVLKDFAQQIADLLFISPQNFTVKNYWTENLAGIKRIQVIAMIQKSEEI